MGVDESIPGIRWITIAHQALKYLHTRYCVQYCSVQYTLAGSPEGRLPMGDGTWLLYEDGGLEDGTNNEEPLETKINQSSLWTLLRDKSLGTSAT